MIQNSKEYRKEFWNKIRGFCRLEQYRKVYFYDKRSPTSDSAVLGYIGHNFYEEAFEYAKKLKTEVIIQLHLKMWKYFFDGHMLLFEKQINRTKNLTKGSWKTVISVKEIWKILSKKRTNFAQFVQSA